MTDPTTAAPTVDAREVEKFRRMAAEWWDPKGKFRPLHKLGPARLQFIRDALTSHFGLPSGGMTPLKGLALLDIGCGGGIVSEPLARMGATVTGIDPGDDTIAAARGHADANGLAIDYRVGLIDDLAASGGAYDCAVCLEVVEHVPDVGAFLKTAALLVKPGGLLVLSTINRTIKSYALAIVAAEYVLGWIPRGTHQWDRFVTPDELSRHLIAAGMEQPRFAGLSYDLVTDGWQLSSDTGVNYLAACSKPA